VERLSSDLEDIELDDISGEEKILLALALNKAI